MNKILYLHGFNSSPQSYKARLVQAYLEQRSCPELLICPQIPEVPGDAKQFLEQLVESTMTEHRLCFIGSSLGGYYAIYLAEKYTGSAVLINPSVKPYDTLRAHLGKNKFYFDDGCWEFDESHIQQLKSMDVSSIKQPDRYMVLLQTGDETLDYRQAVDKFKKSRCVIEQGGDHSFIGLQRHLPAIMRFCNIACE
jgi:uncharacterized protein